jgi:hypothetical protein
MVCPCGRTIVILPHPGRNRHGKHGPHAIKAHDLCRQCFRKMMNNALNAQRLGKAS